MKEEHYTKNEIDLMHTPINEKLDRILVQTTKHNGRMDKIEQWKSYITGGLAVIVFIIVPLLVWSLSQLISVDEKIYNGLQKELANYEITIAK